MKRISAILVPVLFLVGCSNLLNNGKPPATQTQGGMVSVTYERDTGNFTISADQPSNPDQEATIDFEVIPFDYTTIPVDGEIQLPHDLSKQGFRVRATTGSSRADKFAGLALKLDSYKPFTYVGAGLCLAGVVIFIASFKFPLIPKMAGPIVFAGGAATAYLATAIPEYGHYALIICCIGFVAWYYHQTAAVKDPAEFKKKANGPTTNK